MGNLAACVVMTRGYVRMQKTDHKLCLTSSVIIKQQKRGNVTENKEKHTESTYLAFKTSDICRK